MPTENRSSNTEMVSVPPYIGLEPLVGRYYPAQCRRCGWVGSSEELTEDDAQCTRDIGDRLCLGDCDELERHDLLNIIQAMAAPQSHPAPIAWMVGTAFWWTKEEAERDAAATGLPIVGLGPMAGIAPAEQHQGEPVAWRGLNDLGEVVTEWIDGVPPEDMVNLCGTPASFAKIEQAYTHADPGEVERLRANLEMARRERNNYLGWCRDARGEAIKLRAQLAELTEAFSESQEEVVKRGKMLAEAQQKYADELGRRLAGEVKQEAKLAEAQALLRLIAEQPTLNGVHRARIKTLLSASAEPSALPDPLGCNACAHTECGRFDGPRHVECRAMTDNACARPGASS